MLKNIRDGICSSLSSHFVSVPVYTTSVESSTKSPYFVVRCEKAEFKRIIGNRFYYLNTFSIVYNGELGKALENFDLFCKALEYIDVEGDLVRGVINSSEVVDDVITFKCSFNMVVYKVEVYENEEGIEKMEELVRK